MPRNGAGTYVLPAGNPVVSGTTIASAWANTTLTDVGNEISNSLPRDGQAPATANIPLGGFKMIGSGAATSNGDLVRFEQAALLAAANTFTAAQAISSGNLNFSGTGQKITGDFTNATIGNRLMFQTNTANSVTAVSAVPSGSGNASYMQLFNSSDPANSSFCHMSMQASEVQFSSSKTGTGTTYKYGWFSDATRTMSLTTAGVLTCLSDIVSSAAISATTSISGATASGAMIAAQSDMESASATNLLVTPGAQQFHPSAAKCWIFVTVSAGTPTIAASYNITSITDTSTGVLTITIGTDFSSANWMSLIGKDGSNAASPELYASSKAAGSVVINQITAGVGPQDPAAWDFAGFGDQ